MPLLTLWCHRHWGWLSGLLAGLSIRITRGGIMPPVFVLFQAKEG